MEDYLWISEEEWISKRLTCDAAGGRYFISCIDDMDDAESRPDV